MNLIDVYSEQFSPLEILLAFVFFVVIVFLLNFIVKKTIQKFSFFQKTPTTIISICIILLFGAINGVRLTLNMLQTDLTGFLLISATFIPILIVIFGLIQMKRWAVILYIITTIIDLTSLLFIHLFTPLYFFRFTFLIVLFFYFPKMTWK
jgi:hypothetical protein